MIDRAIAVLLPYSQLILVAVAIIFIALAGLFIWLRNRGADEPPAEDPATYYEPPEVELTRLLKEGGNGAVRITGELRVSGNTVLPSGFVMDGSLTILEGASLDALVEVHGNATLETNATLVRPILVRGDLTLGRNARVPACRVDGAVHMHPGAVVGSLLDCGTLYVHEDASGPRLVQEQTRAIAETTS